MDSKITIYEEYSIDKDQYILDEGYCLHRAEYENFSYYWTLYRNEDVDFKMSYEKIRNDVSERDVCWWIMYQNKKIGGVIMLPNTITGLFFIPPNENDYRVLKLLINQLLYWSNKNKEIYAFEVLPHEIEQYQRLGFQIKRSKRCMIRPTEVYKVTWEDKFEVITPKEDHEIEIARLLYTSFACQLGIEAERSLDDHLVAVRKYFERCKQANILNDASCLIFDKYSRRLVGVCLILLNNEMPIVYFTAVDPKYRRKGLALKMLKQAISILKNEYSLIRLYVTIGNPAELLYYNMGFLPGIVQYTLCLPYKK